MNHQQSNKKKKISIIIPCRNEEKFIGDVLENVIAQDYPAELLEVFVVDGISTDNTGQIIRDFAEKYSHIKYLENPQKVVPFGLNRAIRESNGEVIIRMDAHSIYPVDYVSKLTEGLTKYNCDNTGGIWITEPADNTPKAKAIAAAISHPFGIGNAYYRLEVKQPRQVDTVPFGCYHKEVFDKIGLFDEELVRNQDDEFNARLIKNGGKIYLLPEVKIRYFARERISKTAAMFYQYGLYKPLVNRKIGRPATWRQFAPLFMVLFLFFFGISSLLSLTGFVIFLIGAGIYILSDLLVSFSIVQKKSSGIQVLIYLLVLFPVIHISYGWGYLKGIFRFIIFRRQLHPSHVNINR